ncbi:MAG TPA: pteridine-dependent deoxygenase [Dokdonella sp.]
MSLPAVPVAPLSIRYEHGALDALLGADDVLAVIGFGRTAPASADPRVLRVGLEPLEAGTRVPFEVWRGATPVRHGRDGELAWSSDGEHLFFAIDVDEAARGGIEGAAEHAYACLGRFVAASATPHILRLWNYLDAINLGGGDDERYRRFCAGRARGMDAHVPSRYPAATAIGRHDGVRRLQVYGLAARHAGTPVENPRQVSAWRYPREYGPTAPTFARGMRTASAELLISGTAAVVGHASRHAGDIDAQLTETIANLESLAVEAGARAPGLDGHSVMKAYVRHEADAPHVAAMLHARLPSLGGLLLLGGDICRRELLVEVDGVHVLED